MNDFITMIADQDLAHITGGGNEISGTFTVNPPMGTLVFTQALPEHRLDTSFSTNGKDWETRVQFSRESRKTSLSLSGWIGTKDRDLNGGIAFSMKW